MDWRDRTIGIVIGAVLGVGVVVAFVFVLSDQTVDAPSLSGVSSTTTTTQQKPRGSSPPSEPTPAPPRATVRVIGGAPPPSGPAELHYRRGENIRFRVITDSTVELRVTGYGVRSTVGPNNAGTTFNFQASRTGTFAVIVAGSHIDVANITVSGSSH